MHTWQETISQLAFVPFTVVFLSGMALAWLLSIWMKLHLISKELREQSLTRMAPILTVLPTSTTLGDEQESFQVTVNNSGAGPAAELQVEAEWGNRRWASRLPRAVDAGSVVTVDLAPVAPSKRAGARFLLVTVRYATLMGLIGFKSVYFVSAPGETWFIVKSEEQLRRSKRRTVERSGEWQQFGSNEASVEP